MKLTVPGLISPGLGTVLAPGTRGLTKSVTGVPVFEGPVGIQLTTSDIVETRKSV
jgi:hypothetical protein